MRLLKFPYGILGSIFLSFLLLTAKIAGGAVTDQIVSNLSSAQVSAKNGDNITITAKTFNHTADQINDLNAVIDLPAGMSYIPGSLLINGLPAPDPLQTDPLTVPSITVASGTLSEVTFKASIGSGMPSGEAKIYFYSRNGQSVSNTAVVTVEIASESAFAESTLIGKVFNDKNGNGEQDPEEEGIEGIRLATQEGILIVTDKHGRYHIPGLQPGRHLITVDTASIPPGGRLTTPKALLIKATGVMNKADFGIKLIEDPRTEITNQIPLNVHIDQDQPPQRELGIELHEKYLYLTNNYPDFISHWKLRMYRRGSLIRSFQGYGAPNSLINIDDLGLTPGEYVLELKAFSPSGEYDSCQYIMTKNDPLTLYLNDKGRLVLKKDITLNVKPNHKPFFGIPLKGKTVTMQGETDPFGSLMINDYPARILPDGKFKRSLILPSGEHDLSFDLTDRNGKDHSVSKIVRVSENYFLFVGLFEEEIGSLALEGESGSAGEQERNRLEKSFYFDGRLAYYFKAEINGKLRITSALDTARDTDDLYKDTGRSSVTYGDDSRITYDATSTQDKFFLLLEMDKSYFKWGSYGTGFTGTELSRYNRSLHGAKLHYESTGQSPQGDPNTLVTAFSSNAKQLSSHDELRATGGSLYYLRHKNIKAGSEKVYLETRSATSGITIAVTEMDNGTDYTIDPEQGRIIFNRPISPLTYGSGSIISPDLSEGDPVYVIVDYEFETESTLEDLNYGVRVARQILPQVRLGSTFIQETRENADYSLKAADAKINLPMDTEITAEIAQTKHFQLRNYFSADGGITFEQLTQPGSEKVGEAYKIAVSSQPFKNTYITAYYKNIDKNFSTSNTAKEAGLEKFGIRLSQTLNENLTLNLTHDSQKILGPREELAGLLGGAEKVNRSSVQAVYKNEKYDITAEYSTERFINLSDSYRSAENDYAAVQLGYNVTKDVRIFTAFQHTLRGRENDQVRFGLNAKLDKKTGVFFTETIGQDGNSTRIGIERTEDNKTNYYTHFTLDNDKYGRQSSTITVGGKSQISQRTNIYKEDQFSRNHYSAKFVNLYGINTKLTDKLSADLSYQKTETSNGTSYRSGKLGLNYNSEKIKTGNNLEVRFDNANTDKSQYLLTGFFQYRPNQDITFLTRYEYSLTRSGKITLASFDEIEAGIAYRPVDFDWFNFIYQYRRYRNDSPGYQYDRNNIDVSQSEEHSAEISLDITPKLTLSEKFAYLNKFKRSTGDETSPSSTIMLAHRLNYHFNDKWDIIAEYRTLHQKDSDTLNGFIFEVDRLLNDYLRVGVGYHFAEYQNEMTPTYDYRAKGFFFRFTGTFAWFTPEENKQHRQNIIVAKQKKDMLKYIQIKLEENEGALLKTINERLTSATQELKKKNCEKAMLLYSELDRICIGLKLEAEELAGDYMKNSSNTRAPNRKLYRHYEYDIDKIMKKAAAGTKKAKRYLTAKKF